MNKVEDKNRFEKLIPLSALIMGVIVFLFQSIIYRWLNVAVGATVINQIAILVSTYVFFGLGALSSLRIPKGKFIGHTSLLILLFVLGNAWPEFPLWISSHLKNHEFRFILTLLLTAPFFFLFGMALPQYNNESKRRNFSEIFIWFHLGAGIFLFLWNTFFIALFGIGFSLHLILFLTILILVFDILTKKVSNFGVEHYLFKWDREIFNLSILNGVIQAFFIYLNNRIQGPFASSFTFYLMTSIISLALAGAFVNKFKTKKENYKKIVLKYFPLMFLWCLSLSFCVPYFFDIISDQSPIFVTLCRGLVVLVMFCPALFLMGLLVPAFVNEGVEDFNVLALNSWGNVLGILTFIAFLTIGFETKTLLILLSILFFCISYIKKNRMGLLNAGVAFTLILLIPSVFYHFSFRFYEGPKLFWSSLNKGKIVQSENFWGGQVDIIDLPNGKTLIIDGYKSILMRNAMSTSSPEYLLGKYQGDLVQNKKDALILGVGSGATVINLSRTFENVIGVEIHPVIYNITDFFNVGFQDLKKFKNTKIIFDDGFTYLNSATQKFDLIVNNVPTPQLSAASTLWTSDFYKIVKEHLKENGVYSQWIDGAINTEAISVILKTLQIEFPVCYLALVTSTYGNIVCFKDRDKFMAKQFNGPIFPIENWQDLNFSTMQNSLDKPMLEYSLNPMLTKAWIKKRDWFLLELLKILPADNLENICKSLKPVKVSKGHGLPSICLE